MLQGSPKKIQIDLLLADLALQLGDPPLRPRRLVVARLPCRRQGRHYTLNSSLPNDRSVQQGAMEAQKPDNCARLSRNPRKNFFLSVNHLTFLDQFLNDAA